MLTPKTKKIKAGKTILTCHDEDCPKCGFPETIDVRDAKTFEIKRRICSKRCGWEIDGKKLIFPKLPTKSLKKK